MTATSDGADRIVGDGIVLRPPRPKDAPDIADACADPLAQRFVPALPSPYTLDDALWWITQGAPATVAAGGRAYVIADPQTDRVIGACGVTSRGPRLGEIGYWVAPWARGRGVASGACRSLAGEVLGDLHRLELRTDPENVASQRVAIAAGFTREALARGLGQRRDGGPEDLIVWVRLPTDPDGPSARLIPDLPGGELSDGVVTLRPTTAADTEETYALHILPECVLRSVPQREPSREIVARRCAHAPAQWLAGARADLTIRDAATGEFAGDVGLFHLDALIGQAMTGYSLTREWRGRGYATRAVNLLADWAFSQVGLARLVAGTAPDNVVSQRVLARAGFEREAHQRAALPGPDGTRQDDIRWVRLAPSLR